MSLRTSLLTIIGSLSALFGGVLFIAALGFSPVNAQQPAPCSAAIVVDRSTSVGWVNLNTMQNQIIRLFQPTGIYSNNIYLAFWSFADVDNVFLNYNDPYNGFVSSRGTSASFNLNLYRLSPNGETNYEHGFGYNNGSRNPYGTIGQIIDRSDIIVFMTDGVPNRPGLSNNNSSARNAARTAVLKHLAAGRIIVGGIVGNADQGSLNYVINGSDNDNTNTFRISASYNDLAQKLESIIGQQCDPTTPPPPPPPPPPVVPYSMTPSVSLATSGEVVSGSGGASFNYSVSNNISVGASDDTRWSIKRVVMPRGDYTPLLFGSDPYRDNYSCPQLMALISNNGQCTEIASGNRTFTNGVTSLNAAAGSAATSLVIDDSWVVGTKVCFVLALDKPTNLATPRERYSKAACVVVGKKPLVQIHGGDLRVGRNFITDSTNRSSTIETSVTTRGNGFTYGSWAEYGVFAPGVVVGFASLSGLQGGYNSAIPNAQDFWSRLTFANTGNQYGLFAAGGNGMGTIPDAKTALLRTKCTDCNVAGNSISFNGSSPNGLYQKNTGGLTVNASTLGKNKSIVLYVPNGTVTIDDDINYENGPYASISEIPQLVIIARNITISESVTNVSAWLISDNAAGGTISTCGNSSALTSLICNQQLTINGPVMAQHLQLRRTAGANPGPTAGDPAEVFNLPAGTYLWSLNEGRREVRAQTTFTVELPPYF